MVYEVGVSGFWRVNVQVSVQISVQVFWRAIAHTTNLCRLGVGNGSTFHRGSSRSLS
jgi:hypothetical protein